MIELDLNVLQVYTARIVNHPLVPVPVPVPVPVGQPLLLAGVGAFGVIHRRRVHT